jgi:hypothetical protein
MTCRAIETGKYKIDTDRQTGRQVGRWTEIDKWMDQWVGGYFDQ